MPWAGSVTGVGPHANPPVDPESSKTFVAIEEPSRKPAMPNTLPFEATNVVGEYVG